MSKETLGDSVDIVKACDKVSCKPTATIMETSILKDHFTDIYIPPVGDYVSVKIPDVTKSYSPSYNPEEIIKETARTIMNMISEEAHKRHLLLCDLNGFEIYSMIWDKIINYEE